MCAVCSAAQRGESWVSRQQANYFLPQLQLTFIHLVHFSHHETCWFFLMFVNKDEVRTSIMATLQVPEQSSVIIKPHGATAGD